MRCMTLLLCALLLSAQDAAPSGGIHALMSAGDYRGALNQLNKQLFPTSTNQQEKYDLLMLKGECQLQLKDRLGAFNVAIAEVAHQDLWQRAGLGVVTVAGSDEMADKMLTSVLNEIERLEPGLVTASQVEFLR